MNTHVYLSPYLPQFFLECDKSQEKVAEFNNFFSKIMQFIIRKNTVAPKRTQITIWSTRIALWAPTTTNTHSEYVTLTASPQQQWMQERASMLHHMHIANLTLYKLCTEYSYCPQIIH